MVRCSFSTFDHDGSRVQPLKQNQSFGQCLDAAMSFLSEMVSCVHSRKWLTNICFWRCFGRIIVETLRWAKWFVSGLKSDIICEEMYSRTFENLDDSFVNSNFINLSGYFINFGSCQEIWALKDIEKEKRDYPKSVATFPKKNEANIVGNF